jgi:hypothetical protein
MHIESLGLGNSSFLLLLEHTTYSFCKLCSLSSYVSCSPLTCTDESVMFVMEGWGCMSLICNTKCPISMGMGLMIETS